MMTSSRRRRSRSLRAVLGVVVVAAVATGGVLAHQPRHVVQQQVAHRPKPVVDVPMAADSAQAHAVAAKFGHRVRIADRDAVSSTVFANPDGTLTAKLESQPIRTKQAGHLVDIDTKLSVSPDGWLRPKATDATVALSNGGKAKPISNVEPLKPIPTSTPHPSTPSATPTPRRTTLGSIPTPHATSHTGTQAPRPATTMHALTEASAVTPLATLTFSTGSVAYGWYGDLPAPTVTDSTALYADVLPDIDLKVTVSDDGFEILLVIKSAAATDTVSSVDFPVTVTELTATADEAGNTEFQDATGTVLGTEPAPLLWDASVDQYSGDPHTARAGSQWDATDTTGSDTQDMVQHVVLPTAFLAAPTTQYPVMVDPTLRDYTPALAKYAYVDQNYPDQQYYDTTGDMSRLHVGAEPNSTLINRAYWAFPGSLVAGTHIFSAHFDTTESWAYSCTSKIVDVYTSDDWTNTLTYNNQPSGMSGAWATANVAYGYNQSACSGRAVGFDVTSLISTLASQNRSVFSLILRAHDETDITAWKKFDASASLEIQFNSYPEQPTNLRLGLPNSTCGGYPGPSVNNAAQDIKLTMFAHDPDYQGVDIHVNVVDASDNTNVLKPASSYPAGYLGTGTFGPNGDQSVKILRNTLKDGEYAYYAHAYDGIDYGPQSDVCYFIVDNTPPHPPSVRVVGLPPAAVGKLVAMKLSSLLADKVTEFTYWWDPVAQVSSPPPVPVAVSGTAIQTQTLPACPTVDAESYVCPSGSTGAATIWVAPPDAPATLWVASFDAAQNVSQATGYQFWAPGDVTAFKQGHSWMTETSPNGNSMSSSQVADSSTVTDPSCSYSCSQDLTLHAVFNDTDNPSFGKPSMNGSLKLNGTTDSGASATTPGPAIDTSKGFSVSAWLKPAALGSVQTAVSQNAAAGQTVSGFYLQLNASNQWQMCLSSSLSSASFSGDCATSSSTVSSTSNWAYLTGVWDPGNQQIRLYVNGSYAGSHHHTATPVASGAFVVGTSVSGSNHYWYHGRVADVTVVQGIADTIQQSFLRQQCPTSGLTCRLLPGD